MFVSMVSGEPERVVVVAGGHNKVRRPTIDQGRYIQVFTLTVDAKIPHHRERHIGGLAPHRSRRRGQGQVETDVTAGAIGLMNFNSQNVHAIN